MTGYGLVELVTIASLLLYFYMGLRVGMARGKFNVPAPAMTGHPEVERTLRVQANTLEWLPIYLPALWMCAMGVNAYLAAALGLVWIAGRFLYMEGYIKSADQRGTGFLIQFGAAALLLLGALIAAIFHVLGMSIAF
jgi:glutathione S-transferase